MDWWKKQHIEVSVPPKKAVGIINVQPRNSNTSPLFKQNSILKFQDKICSENISFVSKSLNNLTMSVFDILQQHQLTTFPFPCMLSHK